MIGGTEESDDEKLDRLQEEEVEAHHEACMLSGEEYPRFEFEEDPVDNGPVSVPRGWEVEARERGELERERRYRKLHGFD